jgi:hypothetical protein
MITVVVDFYVDGHGPTPVADDTSFAAILSIYRRLHNICNTRIRRDSVMNPQRCVTHADAVERGFFDNE